MMKLNGPAWTTEEISMLNELINYILFFKSEGHGKNLAPSDLSLNEMNEVFGQAYDLFSLFYNRTWKGFRRAVDRHHIYRTAFLKDVILRIPKEVFIAEFGEAHYALLERLKTTPDFTSVTELPKVANPSNVAFMDGRPIGTVTEFRAQPTPPVGSDVIKFTLPFNPANVVTGPVFAKQAKAAPKKNTWEFIAELQKPFDVKMEVLHDTTTAVPVRKILTLSDIHFPFARLDLLKAAVEDNLDAHTVVLNGDIVEAYAFSSYSKSKSVQAIDEYKIAFEFVSYLSKTFPEVYLVDGNHEDRVGRALRKTDLPKETHKFYGTSLLARIANGEMLKSDGTLDYQTKFTNVFYDPSSSWYVKVGKTIFAHPHARSTGQVGSTVKRTGDYFASMYSSDEVDCVVIGHTHKQSKLALSRLLLIEQGAFSAPANYAHGPDLTYFGGTQNGYAIVWQDANGNCIRNMTDFYTFGTAIPHKK